MAIAITRILKMPNASQRSAPCIVDVRRRREARYRPQDIGRVCAHAPPHHKLIKAVVVLKVIITAVHPVSKGIRKGKEAVMRSRYM